MTEAELPPASIKRWGVRQKAMVVKAVQIGVISLDEACRRYKLLVDEFLTWQKLVSSHGIKGLRSTRIQDFRVAENLN